MSLADFAAWHAARLEQGQQYLSKVYADAVNTATAASERAMAALQQEMLGAAAAPVMPELGKAK